MSDIFREVEEELRRDQLYSFWKRYAWYVIAGAVAVIVGFAVVRGYQAWDRSQAGTSGARYSQAIEMLREGEDEEARAVLSELAAEGYSSYATLAKLREAAALGDAGDRAGAVEVYDAVAADGDIDDMLRDLARVRAALLLVDQVEPSEITSRVGDLADSDGPWRHTARELIALSLYRAGDFAGADAEYDRIMSDPAAPVGLRGRAEMMRALIAPKLPAVGQ